MAKSFNNLNIYVAKDHIVGFGKYEHSLWGDVLKEDPGYVIWCIGNMHSPPLFSREFIIEAIKNNATAKSKSSYTTYGSTQRKRTGGFYDGGLRGDLAHYYAEKESAAYDMYGFADDFDDIPF